MKKQAALMGTIDSLLKAVGETNVKAAGAKRAGTEAGGYNGETTHPTKNVDDSTSEASEGARSAENSEDAKSEPNRGEPVDAVPTDRSVDQNSVQTDIGITSKATGEDPAAETDSAKAGKDDPGSSHPARTDNDSLDGQKFSSVEAEILHLSKQAEAIGERICTYIATNVQDTKQAGSKQPAAPAPAKVAAAPVKAAAEAGYDLAGLFAGMDIDVQDKQAADALVVDTLASVIETAVRRAEKCAEYYTAHYAAKRANDGGMPMQAAPAPGGEQMDPNAMAQMAGGGGGAPPGAEGGQGGSPEEEAMLMQLLQGQGGGGEGGEGHPGGDGDGDEAGGGMPGGEGGEGGEQIDPAMLEQILAELGVSPEEVAQKASAHKKAAAAKKRWQPKTAAEREKFARMRQYISEIVGR